MKKGKKEEEEGIYALGCSVFSFQICEVGGLAMIIHKRRI